jgi:hypothetical protein
VHGAPQLLSSSTLDARVQFVAHGDFDGDGLNDLAVTTEFNQFTPNSENRLILLTNAGGFNLAESVRFDLEEEATHIVPGDFDGDGNTDLAMQVGVFGGTYRLLTFLGDGLGGFDTNTPALEDAASSFVIPVHLDGDASDELLLQGQREEVGGTVYFLDVMAWDAVGGWSVRQSLNLTGRPGAVQLTSVNGDADPDLAVAWTDFQLGTSTVSYFPGSASGFGPEEIIADALDYQAFNCVMTDLNADGRLDIAAGHTLWLADPAGGFLPPQTV